MLQIIKNNEYYLYPNQSYQLKHSQANTFVAESLNQTYHYIDKYYNLNLQHPIHSEQALFQIQKLKDIHHQHLFQIKQVCINTKQKAIYIIKDYIQFIEQSNKIQQYFNTQIIKNIVRTILNTYKQRDLVLQINDKINDILFINEKQFKIKDNFVGNILQKYELLPHNAQNTQTKEMKIGRVLLDFIDKNANKNDQYIKTIIDTIQKDFNIKKNTVLERVLQNKLDIDQNQTIETLRILSVNQFVKCLSLKNLVFNLQKAQILFTNNLFKSVPRFQIFDSKFQINSFQVILNNKKKVDLKMLIIKNSNVLDEYFQQLDMQHIQDNLQQLNLQQNQLNYNIDKLLRLWPKLIRMNLSGNNIGNIGFSKLIRSNNNNLRNLILQKNNIGSQQWDEYLKEGFQNFSLLSLQVLNLNNNYLNDKQLELLIMAKNTQKTQYVNLKELSLQKNNLQFMGKPLNTNLISLKILNLRHNNINMKFIKNYFYTFRNLQKLLLDPIILPIYLNMYPKIVI